MDWRTGGHGETALKTREVMEGPEESNNRVGLSWVDATVGPSQ